MSASLPTAPAPSPTPGSSLWPFQPPTMPDGSLAMPWNWQFWVGAPGFNMPDNQNKTGNASPGGAYGAGLSPIEQVLAWLFGVQSGSDVLVEVFLAIAAIALIVLGIAGFVF